MIFYNKYEKPFLPKSFIIAALFTSILVSFFLMFVDEIKIASWLQPYKINCNFLRHILLLSCFGIYFMRLLVTLLIFFQRKMYWIEAIIITNIIVILIPLKENYLGNKYGMEFKNYALEPKSLFQ